MYKFRTVITFVGFISIVLSNVYYSGIGDEIARHNNKYIKDKNEIEPIQIRNKEDTNNFKASVIPPYSEQKSASITNTINDETLVSTNQSEPQIEENTEPIIEEIETVEEENNQYVGTFSITAYTWTGNAMANGEYPYYGSVASCDFPLGTVLYIEGVGNFIVNDVCPTSGVIDVYMDSYEECINFGRQYCNVYIM